jgi:hypothetical protein
MEFELGKVEVGGNIVGKAAWKRWLGSQREKDRVGC